MQKYIYPNLNAEQARRGLSDSDLAEICGLTARTFQRQRNKGTLSMDSAIALRQFFNISAGVLFALEPIQPMYCTAEGRA